MILNVLKDIIKCDMLQHFRDSVKNCCFWMKSLHFRGPSLGVAGSTDFQQEARQSKNSALVTDMDTTSGIVIPLENLR